MLRVFLNHGCTSGLWGDSDGIHPACEFYASPLWIAIGVSHGVSHLASQAPPDGMQDIIWAFSRTRPESADADAEISVHQFFGSNVLDLTRTTGAVSENDPLPSPVPSESAGAGGDEVDADVGKTTGHAGGGVAGVVHAGLCILAFLLVIPFGALVVRYAKATGSSAAFDLHRHLQFGVGECRVLVRVLLLTTYT
jgi:hypothetical protein